MKILEINNKKYNYDIVINEETNKRFNKYIKKIIERSKKKKILLGIDLEFNSKTEIGSFQLNFNYNKKENQYMFIINYELLNEENKDLFVNKILLNKNVKKIMHGTHGIDLPILIYAILKDEEKIKKFVSSYYDIKFLCNYLALKYQMSAKACGKYDMLYKFNIINEEKYIELENNKNSQEEIKDKYVNIKLLSPIFEKYMLYDIIYLIEIYKYFKNQIKDYKLILQLNQLIVLDKLIDDTNKKYDVNYNVFNLYYKYKTLYDGLNINFIYIKEDNKDKNIQINTFFEQVITKYLKDEENKELIYIYNLVDLKTYIYFYFKIILIKYLIKKIIIYKNKNTKLNEEEKKQIINSYNELYEFVEKQKFNKIISSFKNFENYINSYL